MNNKLDNLKQESAKAALFDVEQRKKGHCIQCKLPAAPRCYSQAGLNEYAISGMCEICFDDLFKKI